MCDKLRDTNIKKKVMSLQGSFGNSSFNSYETTLFQWLHCRDDEWYFFSTWSDTEVHCCPSNDDVNAKSNNLCVQKGRIITLLGRIRELLLRTPSVTHYWKIISVANTREHFVGRNRPTGTEAKQYMGG